MTADQFDEMLEAQKGLCAICGNPETKRSKKSGRLLPLSVDHDHETEAVRGLLCGACNAMLGYAEDAPARLASAILYLASHASDPSAVLTPAVEALASALSKTVPRETGDLDAA
jgi:hypothetical protein